MELDKSSVINSDYVVREVYRAREIFGSRSVRGIKASFDGETYIREYVKFERGRPTVCSISLYDTNGKLILTQVRDLSGNSNDEEAVFNTPNEGPVTVYIRDFTEPDETDIYDGVEGTGYTVKSESVGRRAGAKRIKMRAIYSLSFKSVEEDEDNKYIQDLIGKGFKKLDHGRYYYISSDLEEIDRLEGYILDTGIGEQCSRETFTKYYGKCPKCGKEHNLTLYDVCDCGFNGVYLPCDLCLTINGIESPDCSSCRIS